MDMNIPRKKNRPIMEKAARNLQTGRSFFFLRVVDEVDQTASDDIYEIPCGKSQEYDAEGHKKLIYTRCRNKELYCDIQQGHPGKSHKEKLRQQDAGQQACTYGYYAEDEAFYCKHQSELQIVDTHKQINAYLLFALFQKKS